MAKVLIVDDDQALLTVFTTALQKAGFEVLTALTGTEGIEKAKAEKPNLILLDQVLPDINGNEILKKLKEDPQTQSLKIAMLSNFGQNELIEQAIQAGALDYILKYQIEPEDLVNKVNGLLKEQEKEENAVA